MPTIRTVFQPGVDVDVDDAEHAVLHAQGLVHAPAPVIAAQEAPSVPEQGPAADGRTKTPKPKTATDEQPATADACLEQEGK